MSRLTLPNLLGLFRLAATPVLVALILWPFPGAGFVAFVLYVPAALSDFVDGRIARARNQVTTFGVFLDLTADKVLVAGVLIALAQTDLVPAWLVIVILIRELVVGGVRQVAANEQIVVGSQLLGKAKTVVTMIAIAVLLLAFDAQTGGPMALDRPGRGAGHQRGMAAVRRDDPGRDLGSGLPARRVAHPGRGGSARYLTSLVARRRRAMTMATEPKTARYATWTRIVQPTTPVVRPRSSSTAWYRGVAWTTTWSHGG